MGVAELSGLLTGGVTPTRRDSLSRALQMVRCELCMPKLMLWRVLNTPPPTPFSLRAFHMSYLLLQGKNGNDHKL